MTTVCCYVFIDVNPLPSKSGMGTLKMQKYHRFAEFIKIQGPAWWNWKQGAMTCPNTLNINNSYSRPSLYTTRGLRFIFTSFQLTTEFLKFIDYCKISLTCYFSKYTIPSLITSKNSKGHSIEQWKGRLIRGVRMTI